MKNLRYYRIGKAVYDRITDEEKPMPDSLEKLAAEMVKEGAIPAHMTPEERSFFWRCLTCVRGGEELTEEEFIGLDTNGECKHDTSSAL